MILCLPIRKALSIESSAVCFVFSVISWFRNTLNDIFLFSVLLVFYWHEMTNYVLLKHCGNIANQPFKTSLFLALFPLTIYPQAGNLSKPYEINEVSYNPSTASLICNQQAFLNCQLSASESHVQICWYVSTFWKGREIAGHSTTPHHLI